MLVKKLYITIISLISLVLVQSCTTEVEICYDDIHPHLAELEVVYDWSQDANNIVVHQHYDSMYVFAYRVLREWGCCSQTTPYDEDTILVKGKNKGKYLLGTKPTNYDLYMAGITGNGDDNGDDNGDNGDDNGDDIVDDNGDNGDDNGDDIVDDNGDNGEDYGDDIVDDNDDNGEVTVPSDRLLLREGEYKFFSFNYKKDCPSHKINYETLSQMMEAISSENLMVEYKTYGLSSQQDTLMKRYGKNWYDFNPYSKYINTDAEPIFYYYSPGLQQIKKGDKPNKALFAPRCVTQDIVFNFCVATVDVDSIYDVIAEISGIPESINIMTEELGLKKTYKMLFRVNQESTELVPSEDPALSDTVKYHFSGKISVTGLVASNDPKAATGAGILQLAIYSRAKNSDGQVKNKLYSVGVNLYNTIRKYKSEHINECDCPKLENCGVIHRYQMPAMLNIPSFLTINRNEILEHSDDDATIDNWIIYNDDIYVDL